ncbi:STAS domain-containing protein [Streptomyces sp. NPDC020096]
MTIQWRYTTRSELGILSVSGYLGAEAVPRFLGAVGWVIKHGTGPLVLDLTSLRGWSAVGQTAIADAARRLAVHNRPLELAAIPADGSLVPDGTKPPLTVHCDLTTALTAHHVPLDETETQQEWRTTGYPNDAPPATG